MRRVAITVISVGGTMDKNYGAGIGVTDMHIAGPYANNFLRQHGGVNVDFTFRSVVRKDSVYMDDKDIQEVVDAYLAAKTKRVIITHGTDKLLETANAISLSLLRSRSVVVLTGALRPATMKESDADFQLGLALATSLLAAPGIWIALNHVYYLGQCYKDESTGQFVPY